MSAASIVGQNCSNTVKWSHGTPRRRWRDELDRLHLNWKEDARARQKWKEWREPFAQEWDKQEKKVRTRCVSLKELMANDSCPGRTSRLSRTYWGWSSRWVTVYWNEFGCQRNRKWWCVMSERVYVSFYRPLAEQKPSITIKESQARNSCITSLPHGILRELLSIYKSTLSEQTGGKSSEKSIPLRK